MSKRYKIELTKNELAMLRLVVSNGHSEGEFEQHMNKRDVKALREAMHKLDDAYGPEYRLFGPREESGEAQ